MKAEDLRETGQGLSRRQFVKLSTLGMLTVGVLTSCDDDDDDQGAGSETPTETPSPSQAVTVDRSSFPQSVATGDPRPDSMVFWTRVVGGSATEIPLRLIVGLDRELRDVVMDATFTARPEFDGIVKVQVGQMEPGTTYWYQFQLGTTGSVVGRTKTAPRADSDVPVKFAFISCQDYRNRYYNPLTQLANFEDVDVVLHLGDYIYEVVPRDVTGDRETPFSDQDSALDLGDGTLAARSVSNYRDLYKAYRSDALMQQLHERMPMIAIWDDHEFSNDSWGVHGTYFEGARIEDDLERKQNSERVHAEYMPTALGLNANGDLAIGDETLYPNIALYRDFRFGRHLHLVMTDYRSFRPDHAVPENAHPGEIALNQQALTLAFAAQGIPIDTVADQFDRYFDLSDPNFAPYQLAFIGVMTQQYLAAGLDQAFALQRAQEAASGIFSLFVGNQLIQAFNQANPNTPLPAIAPEGLAVGLGYWMLGKQDVLTAGGVGARYFVVKGAYDLLSAVRLQATGGQSENVFGDAQDAWFRNAILNSDATWRVIGNSCSMTTMILDLRGVDLLPAQFQQEFYLNVDQWDGFPNKRNEILDLLRQQGNAILLAGDIHASHVAEHGGGVYEFTVAGLSSTPFKGFLRQATVQPPFDQFPTVQGLVANLEELLLEGSPEVNGQKQMRYTRNDVNGFCVVRVDGSSATGTYYHLEENEVFTNQYESAELPAKFSTVEFQIAGGRLTQTF